MEEATADGGRMRSGRRAGAGHDCLQRRAQTRSEAGDVTAGRARFGGVVVPPNAARRLLGFHMLPAPVVSEGTLMPELNTVILVSGDTGKPGSVLFARSWELPPLSAEAFAQAMTERFGEPACEAVGSADSCLEHAERAGILFFSAAGKEPEDV
jgi:hypothetical protein